jgi:hypothetical protein
MRNMKCCSIKIVVNYWDVHILLLIKVKEIVMKKKLFLLGMAAVVLAFGLVFVGCKNSASNNSGGGGGGKYAAFLQNRNAIFIPPIGVFDGITH